jgi:LytTr DNA-binding domain
MATGHIHMPSRSFPGLNLLGGADPKQTRDKVIFHTIVPLTFGAILGANQAGIAFYLPWLMSVVYWVVLSLITWQILHWITVAVAAVTRPINPPLTLILIVGALITTFVMRPFMYQYSGVFSEYLVNGRTVQPMAPFRWDFEFLLRHLQLWAGMMVVWVAINMIFDRFVGAPRYRAVNIAPKQPDANMAPLPIGDSATTLTSQPPRFGLPPNSEILALKAEDHYVRVFSNHGEKLILMRISDAIKELAGLEGARVHRSYWVAKQAVEHRDMQGRNIVLHLKNGLQIPISQTYKEFARQVGLVS